MRDLKRLLVIGSSVSVQKTGYLTHLKTELTSASKGSPDVIILNASLGGCTAEAALSYLETGLFYDLSRFSPDAVIIEKIINERTSSFSRQSTGQKELTEAKIKNRIRELIEFATSLGGLPILLCPLFRSSPSFSWDRDSPEGYLKRISYQVSNETGSYLIDINNKLEDCDKYLLDDVHTNDNGSKLMAKIIAMHLCSPEFRSWAENKKNELPQQSQSSATRRRHAIFKGTENLFESSLVTARYSMLSENCAPKVIELDYPTSVTGAFFISFPFAAGVQLDSDTGESAFLDTFDHMSFLNRLHFLEFKKPIQARKSLSIRSISSAYPVGKTIASFFNSKTFDPQSEWAIKKYLEPLLLRREGKGELPSCRISAIIATQS